jgi:hypothetical protein
MIVDFEKLTLCGCLDKAREDKAQIVTRVEAVPQGTGSKCHETGAEAGLLTTGRDAQIDVVPEPVVGVYVPPAEVSSRVLGRLDSPGVNVLQTVP